MNEDMKRIRGTRDGSTLSFYSYFTTSTLTFLSTSLALNLFNTQRKELTNAFQMLSKHFCDSKTDTKKLIFAEINTNTGLKGTGPRGPRQQNTCREQKDDTVIK